MIRPVRRLLTPENKRGPKMAPQVTGLPQTKFFFGQQRGNSRRLQEPGY